MYSMGGAQRFSEDGLFFRGAERVYGAILWVLRFIGDGALLFVKRVYSMILGALRFIGILCGSYALGCARRLDSEMSGLAKSIVQ